LDPGWKNSVHGSGRKILLRDDKHPWSETLITYIFPQKNHFPNTDTVLRIRDVYPDPTFFHPGSRIQTVSIPDPGSTSKNLSILTQKNGL
jgi:hypothetical protein